jgi:hypothetical protein
MGAIDAPFEVLLVIAGLLLLPPGLIAITLYVSVLKMSKPDLSMEAVNGEDYPADWQVVTTNHGWAQTNGFEFLGCYRMQAMQPTFIATWKHSQNPTFFCMYGVANVYAYDIVSIFTPQFGITTGTTKDGQLLPSEPGHYTQTFSDISLDELLRKHQEAEQYVQLQGHIRPEHLYRNFEVIFLEAIRGQMAHVRQIPLYPIRGIYWFLVRRSKRHNRSVQDLHRAGLEQLPTDPGWRPIETR